jgi:signal transduction histidine kinase
MTNLHHQPGIASAVRVLAAVATGTAMLAICGYLVHQAWLISLLPGWKGMSPLTAAGVMMTAVPLWRRRAHRLDTPTRLLSLLTAAAMLAVLASHAIYHADTLSPWLNGAVPGLPASIGGRVSVATAACLLALSAVAPARLGAGRHARAIVEIASNAALLVAGTALLGYAYRVTDLYGIYVFDSMSLQSALSIACLALANLLASERTRLGMALRSPSLGVRHLRRMLALPLLPVVLGWALSRLGGPGAEGNGAALAMLVIAASVPMFYLLLENARAIALLDLERSAQRDTERRLASDLQRQLDAKTAALADSHKRQVESLAQADRARRFEAVAQLTGSIAHDFNNLLMVIGGYSQLMKLRIRGDANLTPLVDKVTATVAGAARLTAQLSAFSRTQRLQAAPVHVDAAVRAAVADIGVAPSAGIDLVTELGADACSVLSESVQLQLAVQHLIRNAWEALGQTGSVRISTSMRRMQDGQDHVVIRIADSGCGMTPEQIGRAPEPFFTTKHGNHHGLGLAQVNSVVQQASGVLQIESMPGLGTAVELILPRIAAPAGIAASDAVPGVPGVPIGGNRRLLVIDDDDEVRTVIATLLRQLDYEVVEAGDGETGLRLLERHRPALAIIDYLMPGMNGAEVARRARAHSPQLSIVFISGYCDSDAINTIPDSRLLRKPVVMEDLSRTVESSLQAACAT